MNYEVTIDGFDGPLDLLLHLIKKSNIDIVDININDVTKQYLDYINKMEELNLDVASEYLVMAAELIEIKSNSLLPKPEVEEEEEDPRERLIKRLLEYEQYKKVTEEFKEYEKTRQEVFTREPDNLNEFKEKKKIDYGVDLNDLLEAFKSFINEKENDKPLNTKITNKEYSITKRCAEIKTILKKKKKVDFRELFEVYNREYVVITFLSILSMARTGDIVIEQESNFNNIVIKEKGVK